MKKINFLLILLLLMVSACSTIQRVTAPPSSLYSVSKNISDIKINGLGREGVDEVLVNDLKKYLKAKLIIAGFDIDSKVEGMTIVVDVNNFNPGNEALRAIVGFGAGTGYLTYTAKYLALGGAILAEIEASEKFNGGEISYRYEYGNAFSRNAEEVKNLLIQEAAKHIVQLAIGKLEYEGRPTSDNQTKKCPFCAEIIQAEAIKCKHCGSKLETIHGK